MSEPSQDLQQNLEVESSDRLALRNGLQANTAKVSRPERASLEVLRLLSAGNDLETWSLQLRRRLAWMALPILVGGVVMGGILQFITNPAQYAGKIDYSIVPSHHDSLIPTRSLHLTQDTISKRVTGGHNVNLFGQRERLIPSGKGVKR